METIQKFSTLISPLILPLIIAGATSFLTVRLSIKKFHSVKWWEKKVLAYSRIVESLSDMKYCIGEWIDVNVCIKKLDGEESKRLSKEYRQARKSIIKAASAGTYIVSDETANALEKLVRELDEEDQKSLLGELGNHYHAVGECITKIAGYVQNDLKLESRQGIVKSLGSCFQRINIFKKKGGE